MADATATMLIEGQRTNFLRHSASPHCQVVKLRAGLYTLWLMGTGWAELDTDVRIVMLSRRTWRERLFSRPWEPWRRCRARAEQGKPISFEISRGTHPLVHAHGYITHCQLEDGRFPSSYVATRETPVTREADHLSFPFYGGT